MESIIYPALFVFGLIIGSFLNVVILRFDTGASIARGRSKCFSCDKTLFWYELIPFMSFLLQKGRCKGCGSKISWQYPLVELAGALVFPLAYVSVPGAFFDVFHFLAFALISIILCVYVVIYVYDLKHKLIPDFFSYGVALLSLALIVLEWSMVGSIDLSKLLAGPALFLFFFFFWFVSRGTWMGLGDAKLALSVGWILGLSQGIAAILFSFWIGALFSLVVMALQKLGARRGNLGMKSQIPFGPFIILGFLIAFMWRVDMQVIFSYLAV
jgi:prepilin signal peptidase PulO-like enzyme (type II secretory pathway)